MIDATDERLLELLQDNARLSNADIARRLEMAPSAILKRIRRLEERGVIEGFSTRVEPGAVGRGMCAFVHLRTDEPLGRPDVPAALVAMPEVLEVHDIAGEDCYLVKVRVRDTTALHELIRGRIAALDLVRSTSTTIVLKTFKETSALPVSAERAPLAPSATNGDESTC